MQLRAHGDNPIIKIVGYILRSRDGSLECVEMGRLLVRHGCISTLRIASDI